VIAARSLPSGGRAFGRGLAHVALVALCLLGLARIASGAIVPVKAAVAQLLLERAFDRGLAEHRPQKPWPWADMAATARLTVPRLGIDRIVLDTGSGQAMAFGPTVLPGGAHLGEPGISVIAAHRDTHFRFLKDIRPGDLITAQTLDGKMRRYRVSHSEIVRWDLFALPRDTAGHALVLTTCYPFDTLAHGPLRYVLFAKAEDE